MAAGFLDPCCQNDMQINRYGHNLFKTSVRRCLNPHKFQYFSIPAGTMNLLGKKVACFNPGYNLSSFPISAKTVQHTNFRNYDIRMI